MLLALDSFGNRISPTKGAKGTCSGCGGDMHAKCGSVVVHHWAHVSKEDCDTWSEGMSAWHSAWQECFPADCQEVWVGENKEHRADVKGSLRILEIQKSPISQEQIREREDFYGDMAWMLCGEDFERNFEFSAVDHKNTLLSFHFKWKRFRRSWLAAEKPIFIHFSKGIARIIELSENGTGILEFITPEAFALEIDPRFDPLPLYGKLPGFEPLLQGFVEQCLKSFSSCRLLIEEARKQEISFLIALKSKFGIETSLNFCQKVHDSCCLVIHKFFGFKRDFVQKLYESSLKALNSNFVNLKSFAFSENVSPQMFFLSFSNVESIRRKENELLAPVKSFQLFLSNAEDVSRIYDKAIDKIGISIFEAAENYRLFLRSKSFVFNFRFNRLLFVSLEDYIQISLFEEFVLFAIAQRENAFLFDPFVAVTLDEVKSLFTLMPEQYQFQVKQSFKERISNLQRKKKLAEIARQEEEYRRNLYLSTQFNGQNSTRERERLSWSTEEIIDDFSDFFKGKKSCSASLAMHVAMFPDSRWKNDVTEEQLEIARAQLQQFNPLSVYKNAP
jgi:competence CoiA-like predicted nuclease